MKFAWSFPKQKRYLSGLDWVISALDCSMKRTTCSGNTFQIVLVFDDPINETRLRQELSGFVQAFPVLHGKIARGYNLAPYWKFSNERTPVPLDLTVHHMNGSSAKKDRFSIMETCVNRSFKGDYDHLAFHLIYTDDGTSYFVSTFDHKVFDAKGGESFIRLFLRHLLYDDGAENSKRIRLSSSSGLSRWMEKFEAGKMVNRKLIALSKQPPRTFPAPKSGGMNPSRFRMLFFDKTETSSILDRSTREAGYLMEMPYLLATVIQVMHDLFESKKMPGISYIVPVAIDKRSSKETAEELFFNYASFFFFQALTDSVADRKRLIREIKQQMYEQVQSQLPQKLLDVAHLLRIAPLSILDRILNRSYGKLYSFSFSYLGTSTLENHALLGGSVTNLFHMPKVPAPPGVGIFFNIFNHRLNAVITWMEGLLEGDDVSMLERNLRRRL